MTNPKRGELEITLGAKKFKGKVTLDVVMRIEQALDMSIVKATQILSEGSLTTSQMLAILTQAIRAGGNDVDEKEVGKHLWGGGLADGLKASGAVLAHILGAGADEDDEGNEQKAEGLL